MNSGKGYPEPEQRLITQNELILVVKLSNMEN
jgi:hypothetical protein